MMSAGSAGCSEVWFLPDDDGVRVSLNVTRQKTKNLVANSVDSLLLLDVANPLRYLELRGDAEITPDDKYSFADRLAFKYGEGVDLRQMDTPGQTRSRSSSGRSALSPST
jgi:Pyridoxamine 5'-phosphate oxidase